MSVKALTLHQPWASLVALLVKRIETRDWSTKYRGRLCIHAGKQVEFGAVGEFRAETWFSDVTHVEAECYCDAGEVDVPCQRGATRTPCLTRRGLVAAMLPLGAIVATCELVDVVPTERVTWRTSPDDYARTWIQIVQSREHRTGPVEVLPSQKPYGDFTPGRFAWLLDNIRPVDPPVPCRGYQGLWTPPDDVLAQLEGAAA